MEYYLIVFTKFVIGFVVVIVHLNLSGKTQLSQMTPVDFIGNFVLGGIIGGVIYNDQIPIHEYIIVLLLGVFLISFLNWVSKHVWFFRAFTIGEPIPIIKNGHFLMENILKKSNKIDIMNVASQLHAQGIQSFQQVRYAQIEPSGALTVVCKSSKLPSVILMKNDNVRTSELKDIGKNQQWLEDEIKKLKIDPKEIFIAEFWDGTVSFVLKNGESKQDPDK
ncbi:DUF421 domain-containing protein [Neisseriaceae bacterium ESL0693]|nr:DUF421 domain-containing protein [Neisseriaceae bacterium ESL0693]